VDDRAECLALARAFPLGLIVATGPQGPGADLLPFLVDETGSRLLAHVARANPLVELLAQPQKALVVFNCYNAYVSPSLYPSKREHGRVVPTWNYVMVQVAGVARLRPEPDWLAAQLDALTGQQEASLPKPWARQDAPDDFIAAQMRAIVGLEIDIEAVTGKYKLSQNRNDADRLGVIAGLAASESPQDRSLARFQAKWAPVRVKKTL
jgi:transcriptional regulator